MKDSTDLACPRCGARMFPYRNGNLVCQACGHEQPDNRL